MASARLHQRIALNITPSRSHAGAVNTPRSHAGSAMSPLKRRRRSKVVNNNFTPRTLNLALAGKRSSQRATTTKNAFPSDKHQFFIGILQQLAMQDVDGPLNEAFTCLHNDTDLQRELVLFISSFIRVICFCSLHFFSELGYARGGIITGFIGRARQWAPSRFGLPGTMSAAEIKDLVHWLIYDGRFKYGGVDVCDLFLFLFLFLMLL